MDEQAIGIIEAVLLVGRMVQRRVVLNENLRQPLLFAREKFATNDIVVVMLLDNAVEPLAPDLLRRNIMHIVGKRKRITSAAVAG